jgi:hypothetical protein
MKGQPMVTATKPTGLSLGMPGWLFTRRTQ